MISGLLEAAGQLGYNLVSTGGEAMQPGRWCPAGEFAPSPSGLQAVTSTRPVF